MSVIKNTKLLLIIIMIIGHIPYTYTGYVNQITWN